MSTATPEQPTRRVAAAPRISATDLEAIRLFLDEATDKKLIETRDADALDDWLTLEPTFVRARSALEQLLAHVRTRGSGEIAERIEAMHRDLFWRAP